MRSLSISFLVFITILLLLQGCQSTYKLALTDRDEEIKTFAIDFRKYSDKGFLFMPSEYYGEYDVKGIIRAEMHPDVRYKRGKVQQESDKFFVYRFYYNGLTHKKLTGKLNLDKLIEHIYETSIEWGGDAFTNFTLDIHEGYTNIDENTSYNYYSISGIVIKRE